MERKALASLLMIVIAAAAVVASLEFFVTPVSAQTPYDWFAGKTVQFRTAGDNFTSFTLTRDYMYENFAIDKNDEVGLAHSDIPTMGSVGPWLNYCVPTPGSMFNATFGAIDGNKIPFTIPQDEYLSWTVWLDMDPYLEWWITETITLGADAHGVLYRDGTGDVDVFWKTDDTTGTKTVPELVKIGDGTPDPAGSMQVNMSTHYELFVGSVRALTVDSNMYLTTGECNLTVYDSWAEGAHGTPFDGLTQVVNGTPMINSAPWTHTLAYVGLWANVQTGALIYGKMDSLRWDATCNVVADSNYPAQSIDPVYPVAGMLPTAYWDMTPAMVAINVPFMRTHADPTISPWGDAGFWPGEIVHFDARAMIGTGRPWFPPGDGAGPGPDFGPDVRGWLTSANITLWQWDFDGDGTWDFNQTGAYTSPVGGGHCYWQYDEPGFYQPRLNVTTADGKSNLYILNTTMYPLPYGAYAEFGVEVLPVFGDIIGPGGWATNRKEDEKVNIVDILILAFPGVYGVDNTVPWDEPSHTGYHIVYDIASAGNPGVPDGSINIIDILTVAKVGIYGYDGTGSGLTDGPGFTAP